MKRKKKKRVKIIFVLFVLTGFSVLFVSETSRIIEEMYFSRFKEGYTEGFIAGSESGFIDGYAANRHRKGG